MRERFARFMQGRYGLDLLSKTMMIVGLVVIFVAIFIPQTLVGNIIYLIGLILIIWGYVRMFSRKYQKRYNENQKFLQHTAGIRQWYYNRKNIRAQKKYYRIFKCPNCKQKIRIPKGKGKIEISCPKCHTKFIKKT